ncbi:MAG: helix-turn-helix transcriptional regulator [Flavobacteriales bacterium]|nr:helix-turn-helix transcriptional regulator [Flavobacteriales bacterium]
MSFRDAMETIDGKWKSPILLSLGFIGTMRFGELQRMHDGIPAKTLSKELKDLEQNGLVTRTVLDTMPVTVRYGITPYGRTLERLLLDLRAWGMGHREYIRTGNAPKRPARRAVKPGKMVVVG